MVVTTYRDVVVVEIESKLNHLTHAQSETFDSLISSGAFLVPSFVEWRLVPPRHHVQDEVVSVYALAGSYQGVGCVVVLEGMEDA